MIQKCVHDEMSRNMSTLRNITFRGTDSKNTISIHKNMIIKCVHDKMLCFQGANFIYIIIGLGIEVRKMRVSRNM